MSLTKFTGNVNNMQSLLDKPTQTAAQLKALFDKAGTDIKTYLNNTLTSELDTALGSKADTTQTNNRISSEFQYQDLTIAIASGSSSALATGSATYTTPTGYSVFTANVIGTPASCVASILSITSNTVYVNTLAPLAGYEGNVNVRVIFKKTS